MFNQILYICIYPLTLNIELNYAKHFNFVHDYSPVIHKIFNKINITQYFLFISNDSYLNSNVLLLYSLLRFKNFRVLLKLSLNIPTKLSYPRLEILLQRIMGYISYIKLGTVVLAKQEALKFKAKSS